MSRTKAPPQDVSPAATATGDGKFGIGSLGQQSVTAAERQQSESNETLASGKAYVVNPNGALVPVEVYLEHQYISGDHSSIFADPNRFMNNPRPDCMYVWASRQDPKTFGRIRSKRYRPVLSDELRTDTDLPVETHEVAGNKYVACYDVLLMEVPPAAVKELYMRRVAEAALRTARHSPFAQLKKQVEEESRGAATVEMEYKAG